MHSGENSTACSVCSGEIGVKLVLEGKASAVPGNRLMLRRALSNLIANAMRYTPRRQTLRISLLSTGENHSIFNAEAFVARRTKG